ncbi:DUF924 family protein [Vibrio sp. SCSIO 43136]|uniref:DUF924 family protein n=1 Tax=Vibrio sp. SCSIO 43136 TaxID=2819101 RepID=UPI002075C716|nr:DUF924 family protein [Vibrio sp. SCSIO 43136]USD64949.1 DUF924 domain-containing protein [Vibrio sp. SCSIO 43136]
MYTDVLTFWFDELTPKQWFVGDETLDTQISERFGELHSKAAQCELFEWRQSPFGRLAEIIVLDQFSRNIYRGKPQAFASDPLALGLAQEAVRYGEDKILSPQQRNFLYMPFMHSESLKVHEQAVGLFQTNGNESTLEYEFKHKEIIERFGRYPHRNAILGRTSSQEELFFLEQPGSSF